MNFRANLAGANIIRINQTRNFGLINSICQRVVLAVGFRSQGIQCHADITAGFNRCLLHPVEQCHVPLELWQMVQVRIANRILAFTRWRIAQAADHLVTAAFHFHVNRRLIVRVMMLAAEVGAVINVRVEGEDAVDALDKMVEMIETEFD